jgi:hypothetical protein
MADITAIFLILIAVGIAFPGMLTAWWLLFPAPVERARLRIESTPWRCFWLGLAILFGVSLPVFVLLALPFGPAKFLGWILIAAALTVSGFGSAGLSAHMGKQMSRAASVTPLTGFVRGALVLELAAFFPVLGWFFILPLALITAFGATGFALLNWMPRAASLRTPESAPVQV